MKTTVGQLKRLIREATGGMKVTVAHYGHGKSLDIDGKQYNLDNLVFDAYPDINDSLDTYADEVEMVRATLEVEDKLLKQHGVTHVVDEESFGDDRPHPVEEYLVKGQEMLGSYN
jgi:hypothetical protein